MDDINSAEDWEELEAEARESMAWFDRLPPILKDTARETGFSPVDLHLMWRQNMFRGYGAVEAASLASMHAYDALAKLHRMTMDEALRYQPSGSKARRRL